MAELENDQLTDGRGRPLTSEYVEAAVAEVGSDEVRIYETRAEFPLRARSDAPPDVEVLVFDVLGTVVDERGSLAAVCRTALASAGAPTEWGEELATAWLDRLADLLVDITAGRSAWQRMEVLNRHALRQAAAALRVPLDGGALDELAAVGLRPQPWPDAVAALTALSERFVVVALSNAMTSTLAELSCRNGLRWHAVISAELARTYKPAPEVYRLALDLLGVEPGQALMVAAHPWDLRAAAAQGMRTAFVVRPGEGEPGPNDMFDAEATDLTQLVSMLR